ncbi:MAG: DegV family protein [Anaerolineales bacterium]|nr:DegV family protein [Anaerolineales bacterium]
MPLYINIGQKSFQDGVEISRKEFYTNLPAYSNHPTTATPSVDVLTRTYQSLVDDGATEILSIHISISLSATVDVARTAAVEFQNVPVTVWDSRQLSLGTGFQVETAARMAMEGKSMMEILEVLEDMAARSFVAARLSTLEFLRRSGRMNSAMTGIGSLLRLKPILKMIDGKPTSERVRTFKKAEDRLIQMLKDHLPVERFALLHTNASQDAQGLLARLAERFPVNAVYSMDITPVIGAHIGPGAIGFAIISKK